MLGSVRRHVGEDKPDSKQEPSQLAPSTNNWILTLSRVLGTLDRMYTRNGSTLGNREE